MPKRNQSTRRPRRARRQRAPRSRPQPRKARAPVKRRTRRRPQGAINMARVQRTQRSVAMPMNIGVVSNTRVSERRIADQKRVRMFHQSFPVANLKNGTIVFAKKINAANFPGSRLSEYCDLFAKFFFQDMKICFPAGANTGASGRYIIAYFPDSEIQLETAPDALINQCLAAPASANGPWFAPNETEMRLTGKLDGDSRIGFYTNPAEAVRKNDPYRTNQGIIVMVADGDAQATTAIDVAVNFDYICQFWDEQTRRHNGTSQATVIVELGAAAGQPWFVTSAAGVLGVAPGLPANQTAQAQQVVAALLADVPVGQVMVSVGPNIPVDTVTGTSAAGYVVSNVTGTVWHTTLKGAVDQVATDVVVSAPAFAFDGDSLEFIGYPTVRPQATSRLTADQQLVKSLNELRLSELLGR